MSDGTKKETASDVGTVAGADEAASTRRRLAPAGRHAGKADLLDLRLLELSKNSQDIFALRFPRCEGKFDCRQLLQVRRGSAVRYSNSKSGTPTIRQG